MPKVNISKLDAAVRQLLMSIRLFAAAGDPVSIHTLASAAQEILESLAGKAGIKSQRVEVLESIKPQYKKLVRDKLNKGKNFFKHADKDPHDTFTFNTDANDFVIWDAARLYSKLTNERVALLVVFELWIQFKHPEVFKHSVEQSKALADLKRAGLDPDNTQAFFNEALELDAKLFDRAIRL